VRARHLALLVFVLSLLLTAAGCRESNAVNLVCNGDHECPTGMVCGPYGLCVEGCRTNSDCPAGEVCSAATGQCEGGGDVDTDADTDADSDSDADTDADSDADTDVGCPPAGTVPCHDLSDCAVEPEDCTCLDIFDLGGGYCYPDCSDCSPPYECMQGGCLYVGDLSWEFDLQLIDPEIGGGSYIDLDFTLDQLDLTFAYAYALNNEEYDYVYIIAIAPEGQDGGHVLQVGIDLQTYGEGQLTLPQMGSSVMVVYYESWEDESPRGVAVSKWGNQPVLTLTTAGTEVGEHVVGTLEIEMMEYSYDF
jgi:Cys-rich repeat protein